MPKAPDPSDNETAAADRFSRRARSIATLLAHRLEATMSMHDLSRKRLWTAHREVAELSRNGRAPTPTGYWEQTAHPQARHFLVEAMQVVDTERDELSKALQQFAIATEERGRRRSDAGGTVRGADPASTIELSVARSGVDTFVAAATIGNRINEVGAWWQGRLRRKAILSTAGKLLTTPIGRYDLEVTTVEMRLLNEAPWSHDDRLLSAFELAHNNLRDHVSAVGTELEHRGRSMLEAARNLDGGNRSQQAGRLRSGRARPTEHAATSTVETIELG